MGNDIYSESELTALEQEENGITELYLVTLLGLIGLTKETLHSKLIKFYNDYGKDGVVTYSESRKWISKTNHQKRLTELFGSIGTSFSELQSKMNPQFDEMLTKVIEKEFGFFGVSIDPSDLNLTWGSDATIWSKRLSDDVSAWETRLVRDIKQSILMKKNIDDVLDIMDKRFLTMQNITRRLAITETTAVGSLARKKAFKELGISKYQYYAREDERTCEQCGGMHGLVFPMSAYEQGVTASPLHTNCRCFERPIRE